MFEMILRRKTFTTSPNSGHTATLRSAQMLGYASHFVCQQPLCAIRKPTFHGKETVNYDDVVAFV